MASIYNGVIVAKIGELFRKMAKSKDILKKIKDIVYEEELISVTDLSEKINSNWATTKHNIELLECLELVKLKQYKKTLFVMPK